MGQTVPLRDSPYSLPHLIGWLLLGEVWRYYCIIKGFHVACRLLVVSTKAQHNAFSAFHIVLGLDIWFDFWGVKIVFISLHSTHKVPRKPCEWGIILQSVKKVEFDQSSGNTDHQVQVDPMLWIQSFRCDIIYDLVFDNVSYLKAAGYNVLYE